MLPVLAVKFAGGAAAEGAAAWLKVSHPEGKKNVKASVLCSQ